MKPLLFLDVDGVINALDRRLPVTFKAEGQGHDYPIRIQPWLKGCLADLHEHFEVVWLTTWRDEAEREFAARLELPDPPREHVEWETFKIPHMLEYAGERRWAMVDDEARFNGTAFLGQDGSARGLIHEPDPYVGLTREATDMLISYAESLSYVDGMQSC